MSQDELAGKVGLSRQHLSAIENAKVDTSFSMAMAFAQELGVSISVLAGERSEEDDLSEDARKIGQRFDQLDFHEKAVMKEVFWKYAGIPPSDQ